MTSRHKLLGESPSRYPISAQDAHARTRTHTHAHTRTGARRVDAKVGLVGCGRVDFLVHSSSQRDRIASTGFSASVAIEVRDGVRLGAPALECVDGCAKKCGGLWTAGGFDAAWTGAGEQ